MQRVLALALAACLAPLLALGEAAAQGGQTLGATVVNARGEPLGEVKEIVFHQADGAIRYLVVQHRAALGLVEREAAFSAAQFTRRGEALVLDARQGTLPRVPAFDEVRWPAMRASRLLHMEVQDRAGRDAGEIVDLAVDLRAGRIAEAIVNLRDDWKPGVRRVAVPIERLALPRDLGEEVKLDLTLEQLRGG